MDCHMLCKHIKVTDSKDSVLWQAVKSPRSTQLRTRPSARRRDWPTSSWQRSCSRIWRHSDPSHCQPSLRSRTTPEPSWPLISLTPTNCGRPRRRRTPFPDGGKSSYGWEPTTLRRHWGRGPLNSTDSPRPSRMNTVSCTCYLTPSSKRRMNAYDAVNSNVKISYTFYFQVGAPR